MTKKLFEVYAIQEVTKHILTENEKEAAKILYLSSKKRLIPKITGDSYIAYMCERCNNPVLEGESYICFDEEYICMECYEKGI